MTATTMLDKADGLRLATPTTMKALVYRGPGQKSLERHAKPEIIEPTDAIIKITRTTIISSRAMCRPASRAAYSAMRA